MSKLKNLLTITLAVIITVLIIILGYIILWTNSYKFKNYIFEYFKYDSIEVGMTKEQVQSSMNVTPVLRPAQDYTYSKNFNEVLLYPIKLKIGPPNYILVFYMDGKVVGKESSSYGKIRFTPTEFKETQKASQRLAVLLILLIFAGSTTTIGWFVILSRYNIIRESNKKIWVDILIGFCLVTSLTVLIILALGIFINIVDVYLL